MVSLTVRPLCWERVRGGVWASGPGLMDVPGAKGHAEAKTGGRWVFLGFLKQLGPLRRDRRKVNKQSLS